MYSIVRRNEFTDTIQALRPDNFSYEGRLALYDYLTECEESEIDIRFDPVAICCEFSEYGSLEEFQKANGKDYETLKNIEQITTVIRIGTTGGFIIQDF